LLDISTYQHQIYKVPDAENRHDKQAVQSFNQNPTQP
jgi:hypothetical protein